MPLTTAQVEVVQRDLTALFNNAVMRSMPFYPQLCYVKKSKRADEKYAWLGNMPGMREWLGDRQWHQIRAADFTLANKTFESSVEIPRHNFEDDVLGMYDVVFEELGAEASYYPDEFLFDLIKAGDSTVCWDGQYFFDTDHAWGDSGTQSNDLTYDVADTAAPTAAELKAAFVQAVNAMIGFKRDNGKPFIRPTVDRFNDLMVLCPADLRQTFADALVAVTVSTGGQNVVLDSPRIVTSPWLTTATEFYVFRTGQRMKPFVYQDRKSLMSAWKGYKTEDIEFKSIKFMTESRFNVGYLGWWNAVLTTLV